MTTAQNIIEAGYMRSTASDAGKLAIDGEMLIYLNREYQWYYAMLAKVDPDSFIGSTTLTFASSPATATLPTDIIDIVRLEQLSGTKAYLVPTSEKDRSWVLPSQMAVYRNGLTLVSLNRGSDPTAGTQLKLYMVDAPATLSALNSVIDTRFPVRYEQALVTAMALYLTVKDEGRSPERLAELRQEYKDVTAAVLALAKGANSGRESPFPGKNAAGGAQ